MNTYSFTKENNGWYITFTEDLKDFIKSELALLEGTDPLLDMLANGKESLTLTIATTPFEKALELNLTQTCDAPLGGGYYQMKNQKGKVIEQQLWLCDVPLCVFGDIPEQIFVKKEKSKSI